LIEIDRDGHLTRPGAYDLILNEPPVKKIIAKLNEGGDEYKGDVKLLAVSKVEYGILGQSKMN
jgi:hypothetical protein